MEKAIFFSVILPVYNQRDRIDITLRMFEKQTYPKDLFEVILVDDGSTDISDEDVNRWKKFSYQLNIIRQQNSGRAEARNKGIVHAKGDYLIFCDGDRFPCQNYIMGFYNRIAMDNEKKNVYIGCPMNYYGKVEEVEDESKVIRYSRPFPYYSKVANMYDEKGETECAVAWSSFLVGNSCVSKEMIGQAGSFDKDFDEWGFEHFELALRMVENGAKFINISKNYNFHIPHSQMKDFYKEAMQKSVDVINRKHKGHKFDVLLEFMFGSIPLQEFEKKYSGKICKVLASKSDIYFKL